jgi:hypothetical protein
VAWGVVNLMKNDKGCDAWIASIERGRLGHTYVRLYEDAPARVRDEVVNRFGKGTVLLHPARLRPKAA